MPARSALGNLAASAGGQNGLRALLQHQRADRTEQKHVADLDDKIDLSDLLQIFEEIDADSGTDRAADEQDKPHLVVDVILLTLLERANQ